MNNKKSKYKKFISIAISVIVLFLICLDFIFKKINIKDFDIIKDLEIALSIALTISLSINIDDHSKNNTNNVEISDNKNIKHTLKNRLKNNITNSNNQNLTTNNYYGYPLEKVIEAIEKHEEKNLKEIGEKINKAGIDIENIKGNLSVINKFFVDAKEIDDETIQDIWVQLLKNEINNPGKINKRTLDIVKNMTSNEAKIFKKVALNIIDENSVPKILTDKENISVYELTLLEDIGLLKNNTLSSSPVLNVNGFLNFHNYEYVIRIINKSNKDISFSYDSAILTSSGVELAKSLNYHANKENLIFFIKDFKEKKKNENIEFHFYKLINNDQLDLSKDYASEFLN